MPVFRIKRFTRLETLRTINPKSLLALLRPHRKFFTDQGLTLPVAKEASKLDLKKLAQILASPEIRTPKDLADGLYFINEMATRDGMDALMTELDAEDVGVDMFHVEPADVAVRAWLKDPELVERKHAEIFASRPRRFEYFQSSEDPPPPLPNLTPTALRPLEHHLDDVFGSKGRGKGVRVLAYPREDDCLFMVRHADPRRREGALDGTEETSVLYRPLRFDVVGYDAATGTLRIFAKTRWETSLYRGAFGRYLFGAIDHFPGTGRYTLAPLISGDPACLACADAAPIKHVNLTEVQLYWGGIYNSVEVHRATDIFGALRQRKLDVLKGPRIKLATFSVFVFGEKQPRTVTIIPPNIARYSHEDESHMIDQWLGLRGFIQGAQKTADEQETNTLLQVH